MMLASPPHDHHLTAAPRLIRKRRYVTPLLLLPLLLNKSEVKPTQCLTRDESAAASTIDLAPPPSLSEEDGWGCVVRETERLEE
ncbi:hypothetical protein Bca52824_057361 [Brassica carinata]|uniref:Uncharacterized protein n=1 Tax=Brassica carinata TaxID=52824 RepID=A0A8X7UG55_BRACI|nr:hypothetical protein Bca52824_057361 [Brassica carinata]